MFVLLTLGAALAGELWMEAVSVTGEGSIELCVPGDWIIKANEPSIVSSGGYEVDIRKLALQLDEGERRAVQGLAEDGTPFFITLENRRVVPVTPATELSMEFVGPDGGAFSVQLPFGKDTIKLASKKMSGVVTFDELEISWSEEEFLAKIREAAPFTIANIVGPEGGSVKIHTR